MMICNNSIIVDNSDSKHQPASNNNGSNNNSNRKSYNNNHYNCNFLCPLPSSSLFPLLPPSPSLSLPCFSVPQIVNSQVGVLIYKCFCVYLMP